MRLTPQVTYGRMFTYPKADGAERRHRQQFEAKCNTQKLFAATWPCFTGWRNLSRLDAGQRHITWDGACNGESFGTLKNNKNRPQGNVCTRLQQGGGTGWLLAARETFNTTTKSIEQV